MSPAEIRAALGLSRRHMATLLCMSEQTVYRWEVGRNEPSGLAGRVYVLMQTMGAERLGVLGPALRRSLETRGALQTLYRLMHEFYAGVPFEETNP